MAIAGIDHFKPPCRPNWHIFTNQFPFASTMQFPVTAVPAELSSSTKIELFARGFAVVRLS
jgi:hypothetical protein